MYCISSSLLSEVTCTHGKRTVFTKKLGSGTGLQQCIGSSHTLKLRWFDVSPLTTTTRRPLNHRPTTTPSSLLAHLGTVYGPHCQRPNDWGLLSLHKSVSTSVKGTSTRNIDAPSRCVTPMKNLKLELPPLVLFSGAMVMVVGLLLRGRKGNWLEF